MPTVKITTLEGYAHPRTRKNRGSLEVRVSSKPLERLRETQHPGVNQVQVAWAALQQHTAQNRQRRLIRVRSPEALRPLPYNGSFQFSVPAVGPQA